MWEKGGGNYQRELRKVIIIKEGFKGKGLLTHYWLDYWWELAPSLRLGNYYLLGLRKVNFLTGFKVG